ncbi:hypothetical protein ABPG74_017628 [Tetrahymena malaccensis]
MSNKVEKIDLTPPNFSNENFLGYKAGLRPCRKGGVNLSEQIIRGKRILHNYGHGAGGVSLAPGYANIQVNKFFQRYSSFKNLNHIGIIGSGYMGLFTALELIKLGYKVTIYADQFVKDDGLCSLETDKNHPTASQIAGGYWLPYGYEYNINEETQRVHDQACNFSWNFYKSSIEKKVYNGVRFMKVYHLDGIEYIKNSVPKEIFNDFKEVQVSWGNGKYYNAFTFTTILIEGDIFLKELFEECRKQGVNFVKQHLNDEGEVTQLPHDYIFNCAGIHSGKLFNDKNVYPIKGQLAVFKHTKGVDYYLSAPGPNGSRVTVYPHSTGTACGITHERDVWDQRPTLSVCSVVAKNAQDFFKDKTVQPRL